jgi:hypothetical protein
MVLWMLLAFHCCWALSFYCCPRWRDLKCVGPISALITAQCIKASSYVKNWRLLQCTEYGNKWLTLRFALYWVCYILQCSSLLIAVLLVREFGAYLHYQLLKICDSWLSSVGLKECVHIKIMLPYLHTRSLFLPLIKSIGVLLNKML